MSLFVSSLNNYRYPDFVVALSGGIGCGKSTALKIYFDLGCQVIESDKIVHELYTENSEKASSFRSQIIEKWGNNILTEKKIDRRKIAQLVFNKRTELEWLNSIVHPHVFRRANEFISSLRKSSIVIFDIPLLFELGMEQYFNLSIAVWTNKDQQIKRLQERNWTKKEIEYRLKSQLSPDIKLEKATFGIINTSNINILKKQCVQILNNIKTRIKNRGITHDTGKKSGTTHKQ